MYSRWRYIAMGLETVFGLRRRGFFIPYGYADGVDLRAADYGGLATAFSARHESFASHLAAIEQYRDDLLAIDGSGPERARWEQDWFPRVDAAAAYAMVRTLRPSRIVEIGSGHSTRFMARAIADGGLATELTAIDPAPRASIETLPITLHRKTLQQADPQVFAGLSDGDMLCVDSSHILMPGTDVDIAINGILPGLPSGVVVFFHDIFLPDAYPASWTWRGYNEQNAVGALLQGGYDLLFASNYVIGNMQEDWQKTVIADLPFMDGALESGLWLRKC